jgi:hypothetical protein
MLFAKFNLNYVWPSPYRAVNTLPLGYENQSVKPVLVNNRCLFLELYKTRKFNLQAEFGMFFVKPGGIQSNQKNEAEELSL